MTALLFGSADDVGSLQKHRSTTPVSLLLLFLLIGTCSPAHFLFPDMAVLNSPMHRSGGQHKYRIYALEQEPYLSANGTGYLPELMRILAESYLRLRRGVATFNFEVMPVRSWTELISKANYQTEKIAFGLVSPSVLRTDSMYTDMHASMPTVHTSIKLITHLTTRNLLHHNITAGANHTLHLTKGSRFVMERGSPEDRLLLVRPKFRSSYREVDSVEEGLNHISHHPYSYLVSDSSIADYIVNDKAAGGNLTSLCTSKKNLNSNNLFYGFFGRHTNLLKFINDLLKTINDDGTLHALWEKYFSGLKQCV